MRRNACLPKGCSAWARPRVPDAMPHASGATCLAPDVAARRGGCAIRAPKHFPAIASLIDSQDAAEIDAIMQTIPDPVGTFYRYSLPASLLHAKRIVENQR